MAEEKNLKMRLVDIDEIKLPKGFFEEVNDVPKFYDWLNSLPVVDPKKGTVPVGAYEQTRWERDIAISQLAEIGKSLGEKMDDIVPNRGKWVMKPDPYGFFDEIPVCSECGCTTRYREKTMFCPHCGAKMERSEE